MPGRRGGAGGTPKRNRLEKPVQQGSGAILGVGAPLQGTRKYRNVPTVVDGICFASKREAARYQALAVLQRVGEIRGLECQPRYPLVVNGVKVATYVADFCYAVAETGEFVVEDAKGVRTRDYVMKSKLLLALYGHQVREV
jgi:hypothetical protein